MTSYDKYPKTHQSTIYKKYIHSNNNTQRRQHAKKESKQE